MTEIIRPAMYGAQHPIYTVSASASAVPKKTGKYLVIGHCCESGDILTPEKGDPEGLKPRTFLQPEINDFVVIGSTGAYTSAFSTVNYNSFPQAAEILIRSKGELQLIRKRQSLDQIVANELAI